MPVSRVLVASACLALSATTARAQEWTPAWSHASSQSGSSFGSAVAGLGDVNGDGYGDVAVGAPEFGGSAGPREGAVFVFHGTPSGLQTSPSLTIEGGQADAGFGYALDGAGDVNGDGYDDLLVGEYLYDGALQGCGRARLFLGSPTGLSPAHAWAFEGDQVGIELGRTIARAGDVNADGYGDILVGCRGYNNPAPASRGRVFAFYGSPQGPSASANWSKAIDYNLDADFGSSLSGGRDVNQDGFDDVVIGAYRANASSVGVGLVFLYLGSAAGLGTGPTPCHGCVWSKEGKHAAVLGDVDGDGFDDIAVSDPTWTHPEADEGRVRLYHGTLGGALPNPAFEFESNLPSIQLGLSLLGADLDRDGFEDLVVGSRAFDRVLVFHGRGGGLSPFPTWQGGWGRTVADGLGIALANAGRVDADDKVDLIAGGPGGGAVPGSAYLFRGCERPGIIVCRGDGSGSACPCGNTGFPGMGCAFDSGIGASMASCGRVSVMHDTLTLGAYGLPTGPQSPHLYFQGTQLLNSGAGPVFGDGIRCIGGNIVRLGIRLSVSGVSSMGYGIPGDLRISYQGQVPGVGGIRFYQVWFRSAASFCTPATFNLTNALGLTWQL